jgi:hypothetical protein
MTHIVIRTYYSTLLCIQRVNPALSLAERETKNRLDGRHKNGHSDNKEGRWVLLLFLLLHDRPWDRKSTNSSLRNFAS